MDSAKEILEKYQRELHLDDRMRQDALELFAQYLDGQDLLPVPRPSRFL